MKWALPLSPFASLLVLPSSASLILLMDYLKLGAVVPVVVAKLVVFMAVYVAEVWPYPLHGDAASRDTS